MKEIQICDLSRARNAEHYQLHSDILSTITPSFADAQGIRPLTAEYERLFGIENECYLRNREYEETREIEAADKLRDEIFLYISQTITAGTLSPIEATRAAASRLARVLKPYKNAPRLNYASNTAAVSDFIQKMQETETRADSTVLGINDAVYSLVSANRAFNTLYANRSVSLLARTTSETMKSIRPQIDEAARETFLTLNALYRVNELGAKDAEKEQALGAVIDRINALILQLQVTLSRGGLGSRPSAAPDEKPPVDPPAEDGGSGDDSPGTI